MLGKLYISAISYRTRSWITAFALFSYRLNLDKSTEGTVRSNELFRDVSKELRSYIKAIESVLL